MKDTNFLKENNARHMWHPMAHPAEMLANSSEAIITGGTGRAHDAMLTDTRQIDAVGGSVECKPWVFLNEPVKAGHCGDQLERPALLLDLPWHLERQGHRTVAMCFAISLRTRRP